MIGVHRLGFPDMDPLGTTACQRDVLDLLDSTFGNNSPEVDTSIMFGFLKNESAILTFGTDSTISVCLGCVS